MPTRSRKRHVNELHDAGLLTTAQASSLEADATLTLGGAITEDPLAGASPVGGALVVHRFTLGSGADGSAVTSGLLTFRTRIVDAVFVLAGAGTAGSDIQVQKDASTAISDLIDVSAGGDEDVFRVSTIDDATYTVQTGSVLRVAWSSTGGDFPGAEAYVFAFRI